MKADGGFNMQRATVIKSVSIGAALSCATLLYSQNDSKPPAPPTPVIQTSPETVNFDDLTAKGVALLAKAQAGNGSAAITLSTYKGHYTMLTARTRSGGGEQHQHYADFLFVLAGEGTELTGGTLQNPKENPDGEIRGTGLEGATSHPLHKGDVIHIPAGTPHQAIEAPGQTITLYVVKVREPETQP
jgi:mannose-6-phosphate isomerase-like protein (cupin superfamily)